MVDGLLILRMEGAETSNNFRVMATVWEDV